MSTVPESVEAKRALPTEPRGDYYSQITGQFIVDSWRNMHLPEAVDIHVNAGDVIILNNSNIHCGTVRRTSQARRDVNVGYGHKGLSLSGRTTPKPLCVRLFVCVVLA
jgi:ectoine hydroxylase-related dioxygenase (phytanoyl-CoA dioxygenase family)